MSRATPDDNKPLSKDLWEETEAYWNTLSPHFPEMAAALVPTGLNFRNLGDFISKMFAAHGEYVDSIIKLRLYESNLDRYKRRYSAFKTIDKKTQAVSWPKPSIDGFPFTAENFIKAAALTYPVDKDGRRVEPQANRDFILRIHYGVEELRQSINNPAPATNQPELNLGYNNNTINLMPEVDDQVVASTDYYAKQLVKAGFAKYIDEMEKKAQAAQQAMEEPETLQAQLKRIALGDIRPDDSYEFPGLVIYPIPNIKKVNQ
jgi:hypothetical protein